MESLGPAGVVLAGAILLAQTVIAAIFASKNRRGDAAWRWRRQMEPMYLDLLDWSTKVQIWAASTGQRDALPPLPPSLKEYPLDDESSEEWDLLRRRHD